MIDIEKLRNHDLTGSKAAAEIERLRLALGQIYDLEVSEMEMAWSIAKDALER
jgi:hypothetical protein